MKSANIVCLNQISLYSMSFKLKTFQSPNASVSAFVKIEPRQEDNNNNGTIMPYLYRHKRKVKGQNHTYKFIKEIM